MSENAQRLFYSGGKEKIKIKFFYINVKNIDVKK